MSGKSWRHEKAGCHEKANVGTSRVSRKSEVSGNQCVRKSEGGRKKQGKQGVRKKCEDLAHVIVHIE